MAPGPGSGGAGGGALMIAELGHFLALLAFMLCLVQAGAGLVGGARGDLRLTGAASGATTAAAAASFASFGVLIYLFVVSDFSVSNVASNSHTLKPMLYKVAGAWGNHEGSFLLWCAVLCLFGWLVSQFGGNLRATFKARVLGVQGLIGAMSFAYLLLASNPFARLDPAPLQGNDLNPLLQDPALAAHPPMLYMGYVGFSIVYSFAIAALLEGRVDAAWARWVRPWTLASWAFLTVGIGLGSFWAYYELGWGGWWFWDPVENASFMPWLLGAALLHSAIVTEKRGALVSWTILLAILTFSLSLLGTFLVRSGVLTSVHAFALDPERGIWILVILGIVTGAGLALYAWRAPKLGTTSGVFAPISREGGLVLNNLFLSVATATVLIGTLWPLVSEAAFQRTVSVGPPYFNATFNPLMLLLLIALPVATYMSWKRADLGAIFAKLWIAAALAVVGALVAFAFMGAPVLAAVGLALGLWITLGALWELADRIRLGRAPVAQVLQRTKGLPRSAWGMTLAHLGMGLFVLGAVSETAFRQESAAALAIGESTTFAGRTITLDGIANVEGPNYYADRGLIRVVEADGTVRQMTPERRFYPAARMPTTEVALQTNITGDLYVVLGEAADIGGVTKWTVRVYKNPLMWLLFSGVLVMALGGVVSLTDRRLRVGAPLPAKALKGGGKPAPPATPAVPAE